MSKAIIVYGSETGNTESIAKKAGELLVSAGVETEVVSAAGVKAEGLCAGRDLALFGCSAWGTDEVELQGDFNELFEKFDSIGASGVKCACFASGDRSFEHFCGAVDGIGRKLEELGANIVAEGLRCEGDASDNESEIASWVDEIIKSL